MIAASSAAAMECAADRPAPPDFRLQYDVRATRGILAMSGENVLRLETSGSRYTLVSETSAPPLYAARQSSRGTVGGRGLVPDEYAETRTRRAESRVTFDWTAREVALAAGTRVPASPGTQDRLTLLLQVAHAVRAGEAGTKVEFQVAGIRRVEPYVFVNGGRETVDVPAGRFETVRMERASGAAASEEKGSGTPGGNSGRDEAQEREDRLELWLAPSLCGLPVRIRYRDEHGLVIENTLKAVEPRR